MSFEIYARLKELEANGDHAAIVTVVRTKGSTPRKIGAKMLVLPSGEIEGTIGGGRVEFQAIQKAQQAIEKSRSCYVDFSLMKELGMCCGGTVAVFIDVLAPADPLLIFGGGHVGRALVRTAAAAGFACHVVDERSEVIEAASLSEARSLYEDVLDPGLPYSQNTFVMVTTHDHALDQSIVETALMKPHRWIGLIGSNRKAELTRQRLHAKGFAPEHIDSVRCPAGIDIAAETPEEIAVSIAAELVAVKRGQK